MKVCTKCGKRRRLDAFRKYSGRSSDGLRPICKDCQRIYEAEWRLANKARLIEARKKRADKEKAYRQIYDATNRGRLLVMEAKRRSARRGYAFDLDRYIPQIEKRIQKGECEMTGVEFNFHNAGSNWNSPSLDRIVPSKGYTYKNIRIVCFAMNCAMGKWGEEVLREIMESWAARR